MFINIIDKIISQIIDNFYNLKIKNKKISLDDSISNIINNFIDSNFDKILKDIDINVLQNKTRVSNIFISYLYHYYYLYIFLNNSSIIKDDINKCKLFFTEKYNKDNPNYFNSNTNKEIINYVHIGLDNINKIKNKNHIYTHNSSSKIFDIINKTVSNSTNINIHNVIKIILILFHHIKYRENLFKLLIFKTKEYKDIEIVVPNKQILTSNIIDNIFNITDINKINIIYDFVQKHITLDQTINNIDINDNLQQLFNSKIIYLVSDEFLRYHKDNFKYENTNLSTSKLDKRRINNAISRNNIIAKKYDAITTDEKNEISIIMNDKTRNTIFINDLDEIKIIKGIYNNSQNKIEYELYEQFANIRNIPYSNFNSFQNSGVRFKINNSIKLIRYCSLPKSNITNINTKTKINIKGMIHMRNSGNMPTDIVGFFIPSKKKISQFNLNQIIFYDKINLDTITQLIKDQFLNKLTNSHCFLFKESISNEYILNIFQKIYNIVTNYIYNILFKVLEYQKFTNIYDYIHLLNNYNNIIIKMNNTPKLYNNFIKKIYNKSDISNTKYYYDPKQLNKINFTYKTIKTKFTKLYAIDTATCQHTIDWKHLKLIDKKTELYSILEFEYIQKYVNVIYNGGYINHAICKSCNELLDVNNYIEDGNYDDNNMFITNYSSNYVKLEDQEIFTLYKYLIDFINKQLDRISIFFNLSYHGLKQQPFKDLKIKDCILLLKYNYYYIKYSIIDEKKYMDKIKNQNIENTILIPIDVDLINQSTFIIDDDKQIDDHIILNNIYVYMIVCIILNISNIDILYMKYDMKYDMKSFNYNKNKIFKDIKILNKTNEYINVLDYDILCYLIFIFSGYLIHNKLWYSSYTLKSINTHLEIIHSIIDLINKIISVNSKIIDKFSIHNINNILDIKLNISKIYTIYKNKFFINSFELYNSEELYNNLFTNYNQTNIRDSSTIIKYDINSIKKVKYIYYNISPIYYNYISFIYSKIYKYKKDDPIEINVDKIYLNLYKQLCKYKKFDICSIPLSKVLDKPKILQYWNSYQNDLNSKKSKPFNIKLEYTITKTNTIDSIYESFNSSTLHTYIYNFCKFMKTILYQKYKIELNIDNEVYSFEYTYLLKKRSIKLLINKEELVSINNIKGSYNDSPLYEYNSKKEKVYYFFDKSTFTYIGYKPYNKNIVFVENKIKKLQYEINFLTKIKYLGFDLNQINNMTDVKGSIISHLYNIKKYIRQIIKFLNLIKNDKTLVKSNNNITNPYDYLQKYINEYNLLNINMNKLFHNYNYVYIKNYNYKNIDEYIQKHNYIIYYFINQLYTLLNNNTQLQNNICYFMYEHINIFTIFSNDSLEEKLVKFSLEKEKININVLLQNNIRNVDLKSIVKEYTKDDIENADIGDDNKEEGYNMTDNDNDEDDLLESKHS